MDTNSSFLVNETVQTLAKNDFGQSAFFDRETSGWIEFAFGGILITATAMFGMLGNILSISVLVQKKMRSSISVLLIGLASCDLIVCIVSVFTVGLPVIFRKSNIAVWYMDWNCVWKKYLFPIGIIAQTGSAYFTVLVTFDRFIAICKPLRARSICTWDRARYFSVAIVIFSIVCNIPRYISYISREETLLANHTCHSDASKESKSAELARLIIYTVFNYLIPICTVIALNTAIILKVKKQNIARDMMTNSQRKQIKLTNMLITVVTVYVTCNIFRLINAFTRLVFQFTYAEIIAFTNFLTIFNSAVNYLIYCAFGKSFRQSFITLFCKCGKSRRTLSTRRNALKGGVKINPESESEVSEEFFFVKSLRRVSKDIMNIVGRSQEYKVNT